MNEGAIPSYKNISDIELAELAKNGNAGAFTCLSERFMPVLKRRANRYSSVVGIDIDDFIQEGMLALFRAVKGFDAGMDVQFRTYAITCINNSMNTAIKSHMKNIAQSSGVSIDGINEEKLGPDMQRASVHVEDMFIEQEDSAALAWQIQSRLSNFERQVLKLYLRGHSYLRISELLNTSAKAVDNALQRVRKKLRPGA